MFSLFKKPVPKTDIRDTLFGDLPLEYWGSVKSDELPWTFFKAARQLLDKGDRAGAIQRLRDILSLPALESRHYLQAWHFLHGMGVPPEGSIILYGVVVEVAMPGGLDLLAVYADHSARYYNYSGRSIIWDTADPSMNALIDRILLHAADTIKEIGPWKGARPPAPAGNMARLNILTSHGLHFGEAAQSVLFNDPLARTVLYAVMEVRDALIKKTAASSV